MIHSVTCKNIVIIVIIIVSFGCNPSINDKEALSGNSNQLTGNKVTPPPIDKGNKSQRSDSIEAGDRYEKLQKIADQKREEEYRRDKVYEDSLLMRYNKISNAYDAFEPNFSINPLDGSISGYSDLQLVNTYLAKDFDENSIRSSPKITEEEGDEILSFYLENEGNIIKKEDLVIIESFRLGKDDETVHFIGLKHGGELMGLVSSVGKALKFKKRIALPIFELSADNRTLGVSDASEPNFYIIGENGKLLKSSSYDEIVGDHSTSYGKVLPLKDGGFLIQNLISRIVVDNKITASFLGEGFRLSDDESQVYHFFGKNHLVITDAYTGEILHLAHYSNLRNLFQINNKFFIINENESKIFEYEIFWRCIKSKDGDLDLVARVNSQSRGCAIPQI